MARKMILVSEKEFETIKQCKKSPSSSILQEVKRPNDGQLVKTYMGMEQMINNPLLSNQERVAKHVDDMNELTALKEKIVGGNESRKMSEVGESETIGNDTVNMLPPTLQKHGRQLMNRLSSRSDLISWTPSGEVKIRGKRVLGSNVADLVGDVVRNRKQVSPMRKDFLKVLAEMNVAEEFVKNKQALSEYRKIKNGSMRPPGIPNEIAGIVGNGMDGEGWYDDVENSTASTTAATLKGKRRKELKRVGNKKPRKIKISWPNLYK